MSNSYLINKASGGLAHMLGGIYAALIRAKQNNRFLIIDCETHIAFRHKFSDFFILLNEQYSDDYSIIPSDYTFKEHSIEEIKNTNLSRAGKALYGMFGWSVQSKIFNPDEKIVIWSGTSGTKGNWHMPNLKVNQKIIEKLNNEKKIIEPYISIHFRNTDIKNKLKRFTNKIKIIVKRTNIKTVFLATDNAKTINAMKKLLPKLKIIQLSKPKLNVKNQHYASINKEECYNQIYETLRDLYFIFQSKYFIPSRNSGLSRFIMMQIKKKNNIFNLKSIPFISIA
jgi:hypothetical protein